MGWDEVGRRAGEKYFPFFFPVLLFSNATQVLPVCYKGLWSAKVLPRL